MIGILVFATTAAASVVYLWYAARRGRTSAIQKTAVVAGLISLGFIGNIAATVAYYRFRMRQGSAYATGHVTDARRRKTLYRYTVSFRVREQEYVGYYSEEQPLFPGCDTTGACIGQAVRVHYALADPAVNEVMPRR